MKQSNRLRIERLFTGLPILIAVLVLILSSLLYTRFDLTENKAFTISQVTRDVIGNLEDPVTVTYFLSARLEREIPEVQTVVDLLREIERVNPSRFSLTVVDPDDDPLINPEQQGIQPQQYQVVEANQQSIALVYTGIALEFRDELVSLPLVIDPATIEYDVVKAVLELTEESTRVLGLLFGNEIASQSYRLFQDQFAQFADIREVAAGEEVPADIDVLFVIGHSDLTEDQVFILDQYLMQGRPMFIAADYHSVDLMNNLQPIEGSDTPLVQMLASYGIGIRNSWVLDPQNQPIPMQQSQGRVVVTRLEDYPLWPLVGSTGAESGHPLTSRFEGLDLFWASPLSYTAPGASAETAGAGETEDAGEIAADPNEGSGSGPDVAVLLRSTPDAMYMTPPLTTDPRQAFPTGAGDEGGFPLMLALEGTLDSAFADGAPEAFETWTLAESSAAPVRLAVLGDQEVFSDLLQIHQSGYNLDFARNVFEWLAGDEALLGIRTRQAANTRLDAIANPEDRARTAATAKILGIVIGPLVFAVIGVLRIFRRRQIRKLQSTAGGDA